jgi:hypothetical protein
VDVELGLAGCCAALIAAGSAAGQILACAILFGASQQLFTGLVDQHAQIVLDGVRGRATWCRRRNAAG